MILRIHRSARKQGIADADVEHAVRSAMSVDDQEDDMRLHLGPTRSAALIEVVTVSRSGGVEVAIHAMKMRSKYRRFLAGE
jgi:hypothetical protein